MTWQPVPGNIMTRWAKDVRPDNVWPEYPRPQMRRTDWLNLNGLWGYSIVPKDQLIESDMQGQILVPFPVESALSGVKRDLRTEDRLWYRRILTIPEKWRGKRILLHFEAVDWETKVFINEQLVGEHVGGYLPFSFDITDFLLPAPDEGVADDDGDGVNDLLISVWDPTDDHWQQRGKQMNRPRSIWYTAVSGIWQTVWLEPVPETYIAGLKVIPDVDAGSLRLKVNLAGTQTHADEMRVRVMDAGVLVAQVETGSTENEVNIPIPDPKLWSPDSPHLYDLEVTAGEDTVESYFGLRKFSIGKDEQGQTRLCLNNRPLFQFGPLDQGYWPDGLYTPPSDEAMRWDLEMVKSLGFNMLRKHVKVEPRRYYYHCDKLGLIVWQDMPNGGAIVGDLPTFLVLMFGSRRRDNNYRYAGRAEAASRQDFRRELQELVDHLYNFTSIGMWVPFNEGWGQFDANDIARWLKAYDPTRPVDQASGFFDQGGGECKSLHVYFKKLPVIKPERKRAAVLSEFGGYSLKVDGYLWNPFAEFGYKKFTSMNALTGAYLNLVDKELKPCIVAGLSAAIYTQTTDVEIEVNGFVTYDREIKKMDFEKVRKAHRELWKK